jgi:glycosyltransferase involved in cell wall biosynthesis
LKKDNRVIALFGSDEFFRVLTMKLIIQIPCYNEAATLGITLKELPREVEGFDQVEWLIIDDGSQDDTTSIAKESGVDHIVRFTANQGLAKGFMAGLNRALEEGADVIVNTDADNQYDAKDIGKLVNPILLDGADYVIGARPIQEIAHFPARKKLLQRLGSWVVRIASRTDIPDAPCGFRAMSKSCAQQLNVFSDYTYTLETIIQAGQKHMVITSVPISVNPDLRPSRLVKSIFNYIKRSIITILRIFVVYKPFLFFMSIGASLFTIGLILGLRFLCYYLMGDGSGHIQSVILSGILMAMGFHTGLIAFIADLLSVNRKLLETIKYRQTNWRKERRN